MDGQIRHELFNKVYLTFDESSMMAVERQVRKFSLKHEFINSQMACQQRMASTKLYPIYHQSHDSHMGEVSCNTHQKDTR